ncbi:hypothetical protein E2542_SST10318 [Spatholobus suberectus]|nr:hypothetical protein E2542_SST10318 [Spatholobus suberectus]
MDKEKLHCNLLCFLEPIYIPPHMPYAYVDLTISLISEIQAAMLGLRSMEAFVFVFVALVLCGCAAGKECTNTPPQSSHTLRYELLTSRNETWKAEVLSHFHLTPTDESAWADLLPRKFLSEQRQHDWTVMYRKIKNMGVFKSPEGFLKEVPLQDVRLHKDSIHGRAQQTNLEYLLMLDVDNLLWSFRKTAALSTPGTPYGGWEDPQMELRGHFVGHYLSASALMWASTQNDSVKQKMSSLVAGLSACQEKIGTGYLSAFPSEFFDRFEAVQYVWAPYYTIHKILAGLLDQHTFAGNSQALKMVIWMVDYFYNRVLNVITKYTINRHYDSQNEETGGMNDVLYRLYSITGDSKHLLLAHLFDKPCFLGLLAVQANDIADFHANTHIPIIVGSQRRYEIIGDPLYKLGDSIYFEEEGKDPTLYIIQYISSSFNWKSGKILLNQTVVPAASWDPYLRVTFTFSPVEALDPGIVTKCLWSGAAILPKKLLS